MADLFATYGPDALVWAFAALGALLTKFVFNKMRTGYLADVAQRAWLEVQGAVLEVAQTYSNGIKDGSADGTLTEAERAQAKANAIAIAKANIGPKGLARLGRVLGVNVDSWLASKTEQAVAVLKTPPAAAPLALPTPP